MTPEAPPVRRLPVWLSLGVIVLSLAGGSYLVYWYFFGSTALEGDVVLLDRDPNDSVRPAGVNSWVVNSGGASLNITNAQKPAFELVFRRLDGLTSEQVRSLSAIRRIAGDTHVRDLLSITSDQMKQIRVIRDGAKVPLSDADRDALTKSFNVYHAGASDPKSKDAAETQLINTLEQVAKPLAVTANKNGAQRAELAAKVLSTEQWATYQQFGR